MWLRTLLLMIVIFLVVRAVMRLMSGIVQGASSPGGGGGRRGETPPVKMVADPVCGTYVVPGRALQLARGRETFYFCSDACRDRWLASQ